MKNKTKNKILLFLFLAIALSPSALSFESLGKKTISVWLPYWDNKSIYQIFETKLLGKIEEVNLFSYALDKEANIINASKDKAQYQKVIKILDNSNIRIIPTITNDIILKGSQNKLKDPAIMHRILSDKQLRKRHIQQIISIVKEAGAEGVDIDYENININDKAAFSQFIKELAGIIHSQNKTLNVTVQQKTEDHQRSGPGAIDWREISKYADMITIMCYNYSSKISRPGPICPTFWLKDIIKFARSQIPVKKIRIALPLHGYDWSKKKTNSVSFKTAGKLIDKFKAKLKWDRESQTPYFSYYEKRIKHDVWFENNKSISAKIKLIKRYKIQHIAFWHLGILDPSISKSLELFLR